MVDATIDVDIDLKMSIWGILKLRLVGIKGKDLLDVICMRLMPQTCDLVNELAKREGVQEIVIEPHRKFIIQTKNSDDAAFEYPSEVKTGPARILVVID